MQLSNFTFIRILFFSNSKLTLFNTLFVLQQFKTIPLFYYRSLMLCKEVNFHFSNIILNKYAPHHLMR